MISSYMFIRHQASSKRYDIYSISTRSIEVNACNVSVIWCRYWFDMQAWQSWCIVLVVYSLWKQCGLLCDGLGVVIDMIERSGPKNDGQNVSENTEKEKKFELKLEIPYRLLPGPITVK